jgi:prepilin-type N-terminal cleavage/methylation domain-containing protein/prepilin-type processing-associated H-X9-DG protein
MLRRRKGFTLIELLVVIAIIAILAAMLFPVFARARESARKIQCLSNVKNIALAVQMYLTDYDRFPPNEHRSEVRTLWVDACGCDEGADCRATEANPYLRWPVIYDEYVKNRDVWRCPSAKFIKTFGVYGDPDWFREWQNNSDYQFCSPTNCSTPFPAGWGGSVTDSIVQGGVCAGPNTGGFDQSIGVTKNAKDLKTSQIEDAAKYIVCGDAGTEVNSLDRMSWYAYPDYCRIECASCYPGGRADWVNCSDTQQCGAGVADFQLDPTYRQKHANPRHLGGSNLGFADGHASWFNAETILFGGPPSQWLPQTDTPLFEGPASCGWGPPNSRE